jgi:hypothetical protein
VIVVKCRSSRLECVAIRAMLGSSDCSYRLQKLCARFCRATVAFLGSTPFTTRARSAHVYTVQVCTLLVRKLVLCRHALRHGDTMEPWNLIRTLCSGTRRCALGNRAAPQTASSVPGSLGPVYALSAFVRSRWRQSKAVGVVIKVQGDVAGEWDALRERGTARRRCAARDCCSSSRSD